MNLLRRPPNPETVKALAKMIMFAAALQDRPPSM